MTAPLSDEALADLLAKAEAESARDPDESAPYYAYCKAADSDTVTALVREVQAARAATRCETCKRPLNGWCEPACSGCDKEPIRCRCERLP